MDLDFRMHAERTPNPNSIKWVLSQPVAGEAGRAAFQEPPSPKESPLAAGLLDIEGVTGVLLGFDFVSVTKLEEREWTELAGAVVETIKAWASGGEAALGPEWAPPDRGDEPEVVSRIRNILETDIQPYVAQDGGEIVFAGFRDGIVEVYLQGACSGCPSSTVTLKMGIEARLKDEIPEVEQVVAL